MAAPTQFGFDSTGVDVVEHFSDHVRGKTFVITGPSDGTVGGQTALDLALGQPKLLILTGRSKARISPVISSIEQMDNAVKVEFVQLDLSDLDSVKQAAGTISNMVDSIDGLINNAGIMAVENYTQNKSGIELQLATNHLGHFLLTNLLVPKLAKPSKVVNVSSNGYGLSEFRFDDYNFQGGASYHPWIAYGQSKTANLLFTVALARKLQARGVDSLAVTPGLILESHLQDSISQESFKGAIDLYVKIFADRRQPLPPVESEKKLVASASTTLVAVLDSSMTSKRTTLLQDCQPKDIEIWAGDKASAEKLWELSETLVGKKFDW